MYEYEYKALKIPGAVSSELEDLRNEVFQGGRQVHWGVHPHLLSALKQWTVNSV